MAITCVGVVSTSFGVGQSAGTPGEPAGCADGDIMLTVLATETDHTSSGTPPTGWTKIAEVDTGSGSGSLFWKRRSGTESNAWTNIFANNERGVTVTVVYRGCVASGDPQDVATVTGTETNVAWDTASITPATNNAMLVGIFAGNPGGIPTTFTWDDGITERVDSDTTPTGQNGDFGYVVIGDKILAVPAATSLGGDASAGGDMATFLVALKPAGAASVAPDRRRRRLRTLDRM